VNAEGCFTAVCRRSWIDFGLGVPVIRRSGWLALCRFPCRIDHHLATAGVAALTRRESICLDQRLGDHAPLTADHDFKLGRVAARRGCETILA
jgi:hypothetical protein